MQQEISSFLKKPMTRKEFLRHIAMLLLSIFGVASLIKYMSGNGLPNIHGITSGYGASPYGGDKAKRYFFD